MKPFLVEKRRLWELIVLMFLDLVIFFVWDNFPMVCLFSSGFVWNWTAGQELTDLLSNPRYRFSMVRFVGNIQALIIRPLSRFPAVFTFIAKTLPAGIFWVMVILINDSDMPWWMTFAGSLSFELLQLDVLRAKKPSEQIP